MVLAHEGDHRAIELAFDQCDEVVAHRELVVVAQLEDPVREATVLACVGSRPVYSWRIWTAAVEIVSTGGLSRRGTSIREPQSARPRVGVRRSLLLLGCANAKGSHFPGRFLAKRCRIPCKLLIMSDSQWDQR